MKSFVVEQVKKFLDLPIVGREKMILNRFAGGIGTMKYYDIVQYCCYKTTYGAQTDVPLTYVRLLCTIDSSIVLNVSLHDLKYFHHCARSISLWIDRGAIVRAP